MGVLVFGSLNMDLTTYTPRLPRPGETLFGSRYHLSPGGKGANQAVAAARMGAETAFVGRVGADMFAVPARRGLTENDVDVQVVEDREKHTGLAVISVDESAENAITVISGANMALTAEDVTRAEPLLASANVLLLQLETPLEASIELARRARAAGAKVVLDPAPVQPLDDTVLASVDILTPNEHEAGTLVGFTVDSPEAASKAAQALQARGPATVIVKLGQAGAFFRGPEGEGLQGAYPVEAVDTVAAGDAFVGGLAAALDGGRGLAEAVRWGAGAGALATTRRGAITAMPLRFEVLELIADD